MSNCDSPESDIWDYQPAFKRHDETVSKDIKSSKNKGRSQNFSQQKSCGSSKKRPINILPEDSKKQQRQINSVSTRPSQDQVIDVDLEYEIYQDKVKSAYASTSRDEKKNVQNSSFTKSFNAHQTSEKSDKICRQKDLKRKSDVSNTKASPGKKSLKAAKIMTMSDKPSIKAYFSPKKKETPAIMLDGKSDDEFTIIKHQTSCEATYVESNDGDKTVDYITNDENESLTDKICTDIKSIVPGPDQKVTSQNSLGPDSPNSDICRELSSSNDKDRTQIKNPSHAEEGKSSTSSDMWNTELEAVKSMQSSYQKDKIIDCDLLPQSLETMDKIEACSRTADTEEVLGSDTIEAEFKDIDFLSTDFDEEFLEQDELNSSQKEVGKHDESTPCSKENTSMTKKFKSDQELEASAASGGFFYETDNTGTSWGANDPKDVNPCTSNSTKPTISSTCSWPTVSSSASKQMSIFSFLKVKPGSSGKAASSTTESVKKRSEAIGTFQKSNSFPSSAPKPWNQQRTVSAANQTGNSDANKRQCPFYKKIPGTSITVDAFRYGAIPGCDAYVLTHFHYDHYGGLTKKFNQPIFCSLVTGNLVESRIGVENKWINRLPMWRPCTVAGVTLTLMEANHCPGAVIILFELKDGKKILHTGDFRASPDMETYSALQGIQISELYLDTTYCNPSYAFPAQKEVVEFVVNLVLNFLIDNPSTLIVCGAYTIGKERIFSAIAKALDSKICVMSDKKKVLDCLEDPELKSRVTLDWWRGRVHVLPMAKLNQNQLKEHHLRHQQYETVLAFQPTGWTHSDKHASLLDLKPKWSKDGITLYGVPYSEHSSFLELKTFVQHFRPRKILPTVNNGSPAARSKMDAIFHGWMNEKQERLN